MAVEGGACPGECRAWFSEIAGGGAIGDGDASVSEELKAVRGRRYGDLGSSQILTKVLGGAGMLRFGRSVVRYVAQEQEY